MKNLLDYKEEIHKCSKCGLCQSVCPIYKMTGNDCAVSRGLFIMLNGIIKGDLKLNKNINKYLDTCLKCNACKDFCPSGIDARKIFLTAKGQYFKKCPSLFLIRIFQSEFVFKFFLNLAKLASNTYRTLKINNFARRFYPFLMKFGWLGKKAILANEFLVTPNYSSPTEKIQPNVKVVYFKGCVNEYINPRSSIAAEKILAKIGVKILPAKFNCCGIPFLSSGNVEQFKKQAEYNISQIPDEFDYFVTDCASCQDAFKEYENYLDNPKLLVKLKKINQKSINVVDLVLEKVKSFEFEEKIKFTFHKPCHLEDMSFLSKILKKSKNIEYIEMKDYNKCCGFSGEFALKNREFSAKISYEKAKNAIKTGADVILTSCPACILGLKQGMIENQLSIPVINVIEFLSEAKLKLNSEFANEDCEKILLDAFVKKCF